MTIGPVTDSKLNSAGQLTSTTTYEHSVRVSIVLHGWGITPNITRLILCLIPHLGVVYDVGAAGNTGLGLCLCVDRNHDTKCVQEPRLLPGISCLHKPSVKDRQARASSSTRRRSFGLPGKLCRSGGRPLVAQECTKASLARTAMAECQRSYIFAAADAVSSSTSVFQCCST